MTPQALLDAAVHLLEQTDRSLPGAWPRAVALLVRQALETHVDDQVPAELSSAPFTVRLLWMRRHGDAQRAERLAATWSGLSEACHFHGYELPPTSASLRAWIAVVEEAITAAAVSGHRLVGRAEGGELWSGGGVDDVQSDLVAWLREEDRERGERAVRALVAEWRGRVRHFLCAPAEEEVDDVLQDAILTLCHPDEPRVLAPEGARSPKAWRTTVLRNFLVDRHRKRERMRHLEWAAQMGWSRATERASWQSRKQRRDAREPSRDEPMRVASPAESYEPDPLEPILARRRRALVVRAAYELAPRRAALILLALGADLGPIVPALAHALEDSVERVAARIRRAQRQGPASDGYLTLPMIRVVHPHEPEARATEAARKTLSRAVQDLRERLGEKE